jgi:hypothetical protein
MAKYKYNYSCGHGEAEVVLFGHHNDRDRKLAWLGQTSLCPACYKAKMRAKEAAKGLVFSLTFGVSGAEVWVVPWFSGDTMPHKDAIAALGYRWGSMGDDAKIAEALRLTDLPRQGWYKIQPIPMADLIGQDWPPIVKKALDAAESEAATLELAEVNILFSELDARWADREIEKAADLTKLAKPSRPSFLVGRWNGRIYGNSKYGRRVYLDNAEIKLTAAQAAEVDAYLAASEAYQEAADAIRQGD